jgi:hypothetical protein
VAKALAAAQPAPPSARTVKVSKAVHTRLAQLVTDVNKKGWQHLGAQRSDLPTFSSIIDESLNRLVKKKS